MPLLGRVHRLHGGQSPPAGAAEQHAGPIRAGPAAAGRPERRPTTEVKGQKSTIDQNTLKLTATPLHSTSALAPQYIKWYNFAIFLWTVHLIYACQHFVIASSVARWYFSKEQTACCPILRSAYELFRFHLGSIAFGSLLVTGVKLFRLLLKQLHST